MPGTIQVSILELVGLPSLQQPSSMGIKVSMGKQSYNIQEKGDSSFALSSLRDNLSVTIHDSDGNEIAHTGVESRSIVEKGTWDDIFPLQDGGHVRMRLQFTLTEEEQKRILSMRESAARKKQEDYLKRSHSSSDLVVSSGGSSAPRGDLLKTSQQVQDGNMNPAGRQPKFSPSSSAIVPFHGDLLKTPQQVQDVNINPAGRQPKFPPVSSAIVPFRGDLLKTSQQVQDGNMNPAGRQPKFPHSSSGKVPFQVHPGQNKQLPLKQAFSTSKSTGALDKLPGYQRVKKEIQDQDGEQRSQVDKTPMNVRNMIRAFESSPVKEAPPATSKTRATTQLSSITTTDIPSKVSKKTVPASAKPVLSKLGAKPAPISEEKVVENEEVTTDIHLRSTRKVSTSAKPVFPNIEFMSAPISKQMVTEKGEIEDYVDSFQEIVCSTTTRDTPLKVPKMMIPMTQKPFLSDLDTLPAPISEEVVVERVKLEDYVDPCQEILIQKPDKFKELGSQNIERMSNEKNVSEEEPVKEEIVKEKISPNKLHGEQSKFSWKMISRGIPRQFTANSFMKKQISTSFDSSVLEKTWRSKHSKPRGYNVKSKLSCGNKYSSSGSSRGWMFVEEIIHSCVPSNGRPFIALLAGSSSNCSRDTMQEKLRDTDFVPGEDDEKSVELRPFGSGERPKTPDNNPHIRPVRQIVNIAIMVGFGLLVLLTRQGK